MNGLTGQNFIAGTRSAGGDITFLADNRIAGGSLQPPYTHATTEELARAARAAAEASGPFSKVVPEKRAEFLEAIANQIEALGDDLLQRAHLETALPMARLTGERARTTGQLRMFAQLIREGSWVEARIDQANPSRPVVPKPDLRRMLVPLGPVAVFGASNFPFAFSVAGGDSASALAAGCPVIVKAHPAHPGTSELTALAIQAAIQECEMPAGVFSMLSGGPEISRQLVEQPEIEAVGFTGSLAAGRALFDLAARRTRPIPVYAEMGSVNPIFYLPCALEARSAAMASAYATSLTAGVGQFCTNPGIIVGLAGEAFTSFLNQVAEAIAEVAPGTMLIQTIAQQYLKVAEARQADQRLRTLVEPSLDAIVPAFYAVSGETFLANPDLGHEVFGPSAIAVECSSFEELINVARALHGQLTATVQYELGNEDATRPLLDVLVQIAGRVIVNGVPTGVEVNASMQHGGPYPASTDARSTSVGTAAISRFVRPVAFQSFPAALLPPALQDENPLGILRLVDGVWSRDPITH